MCAAFRRIDVIHECEYIFIETVVVLHRNFDHHTFPLVLAVDNLLIEHFFAAI